MPSVQSMPVFFRRFVISAAAAATALTLVPAQAQDTMKLGVVTVLSGQSAKAGESIVRGLSVAVDEINAKGGIKGRKMVLISRDDEHNPVKTVAQYRELVEREKVVAIVGATNSASMLAYPLQP